MLESQALSEKQEVLPQACWLLASRASRRAAGLHANSVVGRAPYIYLAQRSVPRSAVGGAAFGRCVLNTSPFTKFPLKKYTNANHASAL